MGDQQATDISRWLASSAAQDLQVLVFVATVPFFHSSPATINVGTAIEQLDAADNWISGPNKPDLAFLLDQLFAWQRGEAGRRVVVLGGDVHMADAATITRPNESIVQFVSSPVTNKPSGGALRDVLVVESGKDFSLVGLNGRFEVLNSVQVRNVGRVRIDLTKSDPEILFEVFGEDATDPVMTARTLPTAPWLTVT